MLISCALLVPKTVPNVEFKNPICVLNVSMESINGNVLFIFVMAVSCVSFYL
jgi:hypothetical protein